MKSAERRERERRVARFNFIGVARDHDRSRRCRRGGRGLIRAGHGVRVRPDSRAGVVDNIILLHRVRRGGVAVAVDRLSGGRNDGGQTVLHDKRAFHRVRNHTEVVDFIAAVQRIAERLRVNLTVLGLGVQQVVEQIHHIAARHGRALRGGDARIEVQRLVKRELCVGVRAGEVARRVAEQLEHAGRGFLKRYGAVRLVAAVQIAGDPALLHGGLDVAGRPVGVGNVLERGRVGCAGNLVLIGRGADEHFRVFRAGDGAAEVHVAAAVADHNLSGPDHLFNDAVRGVGHRQCRRQAPGQHHRRQKQRNEFFHGEFPPFYRYCRAGCPLERVKSGECPPRMSAAAERTPLFEIL